MLKEVEEYLIAIVGIVALLIAGVIILIYYGTQSLFYLFVIIIIIGIGGWIYTTSRKRKKKKEMNWLRSSKEKIATEIKDLYLSTEKNLNKILELDENIDVNKEMNELRYVRVSLASIGCYTQNYDLIYKSLEKINLSFLTQKRKEIGDEIKRISTSAIEKLKFKISEIYLNLRNIINDAENSGYNIEKLNIDVEINSIEEGIKKIEFLRNKEREIFDKIYNEMLNLKSIASKIQNIDEIENEILLIQKDFNGMRKIIEIRKKLNEILKNKVNEVKEAIYESQRKLTAVSLTDENKNKFEEI
ncbi:MAG: LytS/YhcK type 5TM receptor domain-containing protein, partial [Candidatus Altarchaeaceae archaeon]